jgi:hypothetical protein
MTNFYFTSVDSTHETKPYYVKNVRQIVTEEFLRNHLHNGKENTVYYRPLYHIHVSHTLLMDSSASMEAFLVFAEEHKYVQVWPRMYNWSMWLAFTIVFSLLTALCALGVRLATQRADQIFLASCSMATVVLVVICIGGLFFTLIAEGKFESIARVMAEALDPGRKRK